jgi:predicted DCC family thiol-disulfide oxidoreductase YuxK
MADRDHLLFYDQDCGFCRRMLRIVYRRDQKHSRRLFPIALQDAATDRELPQLGDAGRMESWHLKLPDGEVISGGAAIAPLADLLGLPHSIADQLRNHPELADRGYRWVADHRKAFGLLTRKLPDFERR